MDAEPDLLAQAVAAGSPAVDDIAAKLVRARVAAALFGAKTALRVGRYELERQLGAGGGGIVFAAHDPELSRRVALKLLAARGRRDAMLAEAHALARLAHPNVVPIFDVGTHDDQIFLVMELVDGGTLRTWLEAAPRSVRDIVRAYRDAGAGLAAAHRAGFIHRDFKPDNALVGADDHRVRVVDFGLVHEGGETRAGLGTPRYMPPEQAAGGTITPAADQYSFCASLREAIRARKLDTDGTRADAIPRWLDDILARGLSRDPAARWPSMDPLLDALALDPAARWRRRGLAAGALALGAAAFVIGRAQSESLPDCDGGKAELAKVWSPSIRDEIGAKLDALGTPYAREVKPQLLGALDGYAKSWSAGHIDACRVHRRGAQSDALFDRRMRCLDLSQTALRASIDIVRESTPEMLWQAVVAASDLPPLARCNDALLLSVNVAPPPRLLAEHVSAVEDKLAAYEVEVRAGRDDVAQRIDEVIAQVRALQYRPLLAKALRLRGVAAVLGNERDMAIAPLAEATLLAFQVGDLELGIDAFARRAWAQGTSDDHKDPRTALVGLELVEALANGLPEGARATRALLANNVGGVAISLGDRKRAREYLARAYELHLTATRTMSTELAQFPANFALAVDDDPELRDRMFSATITRLTELVGATHPMTLTKRTMAAVRIDDDARAEQVFLAVCTLFRAYHPMRGRAIRECGFELAWIALVRGDVTAQRTWFQVLRDAKGSTSETIGLARAHLERLDGDFRAAAESFRKLRSKLEVPRPTWWQQFSYAEAELGLALAERALGDRPAARRSFELARVALEPIRVFYPGPVARRLRFVTTSLEVDSP